LAFAAMLMAGLDGIQNKINPGEPAEKDLYDLDPKEAANIPTMPGSLNEAIDHLEQDHQFLLKGEVFTQDLIDAWIDYKRNKEIDPMRLRPHPYEFFLYYDV
jgi:glutamine synthetase